MRAGVEMVIERMKANINRQVRTPSFGGDNSSSEQTAKSKTMPSLFPNCIIIN